MSGDNHDDNDDDLFLQAMRGVAPIDRSNPRRREAEAPRSGAGAAKPSGPRRVSFDIERTADFIAGRSTGVSARVLADLRAGKRPVDRRIDLHGQRRDVAVDTVRGRVDSAVRDGHRCLVFVHGRGKHSGGAPVLRDATVEALTTGATARLVRAFCTARPDDGGAGALYVLLSRPKKQNKK